MRRILIDVNEYFNQVAYVDDNILREYHINKKNDKSILGNIYKGKVQNVLKGMQAAFIDIGSEKNVFLFVDDALYIDDIKHDITSITQIIKPGQEIMVQISKEAVGSKSPRATTNISLSGRYMVFMPGLDYIALSHRINDTNEKNRLYEIAREIKPENSGLIMRTAAKGIERENLLKDMNNLLELYGDILKRYKEVSAPALLYEEQNFIIKYIKDMYTMDIDGVIINDEKQYKNILKYIKDKNFKKSIFKYQEGDLISLYGIEKQIDNLLKNKIWLKSGGFLIIDQTEALTVIDVNTGKYIGKSSLEETILKTNMEAAKEIAVQLRLRDIGGIIIIDFIDMKDELDKKKLMDFFAYQLKNDRTKCNILGFTQLGLLEMTRKRVRSQVSTNIITKCPYCKGKGYILSNDWIVYKIKRNIDRICNNTNASKIYIKCNEHINNLIETYKLKELYKISRMVTIIPLIDKITNDSDFIIEYDV
ncbi:Rne/Rng family ribonuclease [Aceticella autotrophica]|uniref:Rne/Rng family ribonuclease n=1 Tax=Aceticella autotrophica TaxID=2755338 RepID=A0A975AUU4_9THEO|nr:Rne/Rng family ribonuclease [Aceticella autotrophica]QSZ26849.1 Rne/Rng family ribonuclease [Aceticella autotrophica]